VQNNLVNLRIPEALLSYFKLIKPWSITKLYTKQQYMSICPHLRLCGLDIGVLVTVAAKMYSAVAAKVVK